MSVTEIARLFRGFTVRFKIIHIISTNLYILHFCLHIIFLSLLCFLFLWISQ